MKRRTRLIYIGCAMIGTLPIAAHAASASATERQAAPSQSSSAAPLLAASVQQSAVAPSAVPPTVVLAQSASTPPVSVTVEPGDTLSAIAARVSRTWEQLATYNNIPNPNLIYSGQVINVPPAGYVGAASTAVTERSSGRAATPTASGSVASSVATSSATRPSAASAGGSTSSSESGVWACIASHESGGNPSTNTGNGYYGMYQDTQSSWAAAGGLAYAPRADLASAAEQTIVNERIQAQQGWHAWPETSAMCGA